MDQHFDTLGHAVCIPPSERKGILKRLRKEVNMKKTALVLCLFASALARAQSGSFPIGVDVGVFFPTDSNVRDAFGNSWTRVGITPLSFQKPDSWKASFDFAYLHQNRNGNSVTLIPVTFGITRSFGKDPSMRPYVAFRVGPYWGDVNSPAFGVDDNKIGFDTNASLGITFNNMFYVEARYDWFSDFDDIKFSGFFISAGIRLFEFRL
jgi:hypothetical protein